VARDWTPPEDLPEDAHGEGDREDKQQGETPGNVGGKALVGFCKGALSWFSRGTSRLDEDGLRYHD
jgi:hypothetical protein